MPEPPKMTSTSDPANEPERVSLSRALVEYVLLGPLDDRRQLQDSPILGDVWVAYADRPWRAEDLLITPHKRVPAGRVASFVQDRIDGDEDSDRSAQQDAKVAYLQDIVVARLYFDQVLRHLIPATKWFRDKKVMTKLKGATTERDELMKKVTQIIRAAAARKGRSGAAAPDSYFDPLARFVALAALILWAARTPGRTPTSVEALLANVKDEDLLVDVKRLLDAIANDPMTPAPLIFQISRNRPAAPALERSVPAVKADAARQLFTVKCDQITWAVIDSGIDPEHKAFLDSEERTRIDQTFDFSRIRDIVSVDNLKPDVAERRATKLGSSAISKGTAKNYLQQLAANAREDLPINWALVTPFIRVLKPQRPASPHGTHVAGILGGYAPASAEDGYVSGMCPDIRLYDFRVLGRTIEDTEFAIIAALQYIRYLNSSRIHMTINGANLSLSIPHSVRNYACGRTPICDECERLVDSGVAVVAAAGNRGFQSFQTSDGVYEGYAAFSITDPGNAESVITVGATHGHSPHTYGVSFFSSRGPTGDGRMKPDLVAPGERVHAPLGGGEWGYMDGTSMAAPHVSGAAAMLMARYSELIGQPRRIKRILIESATDLGRERSFQGHGMLDVLRAFQSI